MILFINFNLLNLIWFSFYLILFIINFIKFFLRTNCFDLSSRVLLNDFYLNNFYFFWTSLWYISIYFLLLLLFFFFFKQRYISFTSITAIIFLLLIAFTIYLDNFNSNFFILEQFFFNEAENTLLLNSINKVHPLLLHSSLVVFIYWLLLNKPSFKNFLGINYILWICFKWVKHTYVILILTLYLGCWWAFQEGSWGGWWNWDVSEVFGLIILCRLLFIFHSKIYIESIPYLKQYFIYTLLYLYFFYTLMQLNFSIVSHNFGFQNVKSFNVELLFVLIFGLSLLYNINKFFFIIKWNRIFYRVSIKRTSFFILVQLITILIFSVSLYTLIHNFMWHFIGFRLLLTKFSYVNYLLLVHNNIFLYFFTFLKNIFLFLIFNLYIYIYILVLNTHFFKSFKTRYLLHLAVWILFILTVVNNSEELNTWLFFTNEYYSNLCSTISLSSRKVEVDSNFFKYTTAYEGKSFLLKVKKNVLMQIYFPNNIELYYKTFILDNVSLIINFFFFILLGLIINLLYSRLVLK